jgi:DNA modification methylase
MSGVRLTPFVDDPDFTLYVGDVRDVLRELPDDSVHLCVTSPPYWGLRDYGSDNQIGLEPTPQRYVSALVSVFAEVRRVLRPDGTLWLNLGDTYASDPKKGGSGTPNGRNNRGEDYARGKRIERGSGRWGGGNMGAPGLKAKDLSGIPWRVAFGLQDAGWFLRCDLIWAKPNPMPESVKDRPTRSHEYVFLFAQSPRYYFDAEAIEEPATWYGPNGYPKAGPHSGQMHGRAKKKPPTWEERKAAGATRGNVAFEGNVGAGTQRGVHGEGVSHDLGDGLTRNARSVWTIQTQQFADAHFAVFPEELPRRCIAAGCPQDGVVLDPFMGSGTTALVARKLGRKSIGIELNPVYAALCAKRLQQQSLFA